MSQLLWIPHCPSRLWVATKLVTIRNSSQILVKETRNSTCAAQCRGQLLLDAPGVDEALVVVGAVLEHIEDPAGAIEGTGTDVVYLSGGLHVE